MIDTKTAVGATVPREMPKTVINVGFPTDDDHLSMFYIRIPAHTPTTQSHPASVFMWRESIDIVFAKAINPDLENRISGLDRLCE